MAAGVCALALTAVAPGRSETEEPAGTPLPPWPAKLFAPYALIPWEDAVSPCLQETGQRYYTLAFVLGDAEGRPAWGGQQTLPVRGDFYAQTIRAVRARGGDVIVAFGGAEGRELASAAPDPTTLAGAYQAVVDRHQLRWLDFDIEGDVLGEQAVNQRRNLALRLLQTRNPGLRVTFTLPGYPTGLEEASLRLLADAKAQGVRVESVNVMTMDYTREVAGGQRMGDLAVAAVTAAHAQLLKLGLDARVGITPMIGQNDVKAVVFGPADAAQVAAFVQRTDWIGSVSFWSINRDQPLGPGDHNSGIVQGKWDFTNGFKGLSR